MIEKEISDSLKAKLGKTWNKTGKGTRPAPMYKLLNTFSDLVEKVEHKSKNSDYIKQKCWNEAAVIMEEILSRSPPAGLISEVTQLDTLRMRIIAHSIEVWDSDKCWYCGTTLRDEDYHTHTEHENFWGAPAHYTAVTGYTCHNCGEQG